MKTFDLVTARNQHHLLEIISNNPAARPVAGATDFIPTVRSGRWKTKLVVDISRVEELRFLRFSDNTVEIGPLISFKDLETSKELGIFLPALQEAAACMADPLIRARATIGGNLCTASPAADSLPPLLVLDADVTLITLNGERSMPLQDFILAPGQNALNPGEILSKIICKIPNSNSGMGFIKQGLRRSIAVAVVNAAALIEQENGVIKDCRLALGAVSPTPVRCCHAENFLRGKSADEVNLTAAASLIKEDLKPIDDVRGSAAYRRRISEILSRRVLELAIKRAEEEKDA
jgi:xanthine dehydrogenase FAD-binding subunit